MEDNLTIFLLMALAINAAVVLVLGTRWMRSKHRSAAASVGSESQEMSLLAGENRELKSELKLLKERLHVLERIATDPAERTSREIEALRQP